MVVKVYVSLISCSQEVKKNQQRALMILESKNIPYIAIDITDPSQEESKEYMAANAHTRGDAKVPFTPQIFNEAEYCGDFEDLDAANENDLLGEFLKMTDEEKKTIKIGITGILPDDQQRVTTEATKLSGGRQNQEMSIQENESSSEFVEENSQVPEYSNAVKLNLQSAEEQSNAVEPEISVPNNPEKMETTEEPTKSEIEGVAPQGQAEEQPVMVELDQPVADEIILKEDTDVTTVALEQQGQEISSEKEAEE